MRDVAFADFIEGCDLFADDPSVGIHLCWNLLCIVLALCYIPMVI